MTERVDKPRGPDNGKNAISIPDAIVELRTDVRELRKNVDDLTQAGFRMCGYLLAALAGGYFLLSAKFDDVNARFDTVNDRFDAMNDKFNERFDRINEKLSELSAVVARIDERTSSATKPLQDETQASSAERVAHLH